MNNILVDASREELIHAAERQWYNGLTSIGSSPRVRFTKTPYYMEVDTWFDSQINAVADIHLESSMVDEVINEIMERYLDQKRGMHWFTGPSTTPKTLGDSLIKHGLKKDDRIYPGMAVEIDKLRRDYPRPKGFEIKLVDEDSALEYWRTAMRGYGYEDHGIDQQAELYKSMNPPHELPYARYLGYLKGKPVSTCLVMYNEGVAGLYVVSTVAEARRRGLGTLMTLPSLLEARELGYHYGILHASEMGQPVYEKMGFSHICGFWRYRYNPQ